MYLRIVKSLLRNSRVTHTQEASSELLAAQQETGPARITVRTRRQACYLLRGLRGGNVFVELEKSRGLQRRRCILNEALKETSDLKKWLRWEISSVDIIVREGSGHGY